MQSEDLNNACNLVADRTGQVPEVESATELVGALLEWGYALAQENETSAKLVDALLEWALKDIKGAEEKHYAKFVYWYREWVERSALEEKLMGPSNVATTEATKSF